MAAPLRLTVTDYIDTARWRWVLSDARGRFLADHAVRLEPQSREYAGLRDLRSYLDYNAPISSPAAQLAELGAWVGEKIFGGLRLNTFDRVEPAPNDGVTIRKVRQ